MSGANGEFQHRNSRAAKLTVEQVLEIRQRYATGKATQGRLCRDYRVSINTIAKIVNGESWTWLPMPVNEQTARESQDRLMASLARGSANPEATATEQRTAGSLDELLKRDALNNEGRGQGLDKLAVVADKVLAPDRMVEELLKKV